MRYFISRICHVTAGKFLPFFKPAHSAWHFDMRSPQGRLCEVHMQAVNDNAGGYAINSDNSLITQEMIIE